MIYTRKIGGGEDVVLVLGGAFGRLKSGCRMLQIFLKSEEEGILQTPNA